MNKGNIGDKVLVIKTDSEHNITKSWGIKIITVDINNGIAQKYLDDIMIKYKEEITIPDDMELPSNISIDSIQRHKDNWFYTLDNGETLEEKDVISGKENIRDYKINKINGI
jgi:hypothetical protein